MDMKTYLRLKCEEDREEAEHRQNILYGILSVLAALALGCMVSLSIILA